MTNQQKENIRIGLRKAFERKRRSLAMKESWKRRQKNVAATESPNGTLHQVASALGIDTDALLRHEIKRILHL